jgi:spore maturation protein CgeB
VDAVRILLVGAGAAVATKDVESGLLRALTAAGEDVFYYSLESRIDLARSWLHKLWRARGKVAEDRPTWPDAIYRGSIEAFEMALRFDVDWVLVISGMFFHPDVLELMRRARLRTAVVLTESPYEDDKQATLAQIADVCWTTERTSVERLRARYLRHAYDPDLHGPGLPIDLEVPAHDVVFVGTGWQERIDMLKSVDWSGINLGLYGNWGLLGSRSPLRKFVRGGPVTNDSAAKLYARSKIGLNLYRSSTTYGRRVEHIQGAESMNPRAYELAACSVFQVSDYRAEVAETFGDAVPTFSPGGLEDLLRAYLNDSPARRYAARQARQRILPHTFAARAAQVLADLADAEDRSWAKGA